MTYREIAKEFGGSPSSARRHRLNHMPLYLRLSAKVREIELEDRTAMRVITIAGEDGKRTPIQLDPYTADVAKKWRVCTTPEQLKVGKEHSAKVKEHYAKMGEPERWEELVAIAEQAVPCFKVVQ